MTTTELLNNPLVLVGVVIGLKMANQAVDEFLERLTGKRNRYVTVEACALCKLQTDHKFNTVLRELSETRQELKGVRQLLLDMMERTNVPFTSRDVANLAPTHPASL